MAAVYFGERDPIHEEAGLGGLKIDTPSPAAECGGRWCVSLINYIGIQICRIDTESYPIQGSI